MQILLKGQPSLEARFAQLDVDLVRAEIRTTQRCPDRIPLKTQALIVQIAFPDALCDFFHKFLGKTLRDNRFQPSLAPIGWFTLLSDS